MDDPTPEALARMFHWHYERLASRFGYETRIASAVPWDEVPEANRRLMIETARAVLADLDGPPANGSNSPSSQP